MLCPSNVVRFVPIADIKLYRGSQPPIRVERMKGQSFAGSNITGVSGYLGKTIGGREGRQPVRSARQRPQLAATGCIDRFDHNRDEFHPTWYMMEEISRYRRNAVRGTPWCP